MADIAEYLRLYVEEEIQKITDEIALNLENNIKAQLYEGHGRDKGNLRRNIRVDTRHYQYNSIITGYYDEGNADYGEYVLLGIRGKGVAKAGPIDFLGDGLRLTLEAYR